MLLSPSPASLCCSVIIWLPLVLFFIGTTSYNPVKLFFPNNVTTTTIPPPAPLPPPPPPADDDALFHLATHEDPNPSSAPKKIAFMFMTTNPLPFAGLWELFFLQSQTRQQNPTLFNIYIHADPSYPYNPPFSGLFSGRLIPSKPTQRGSPSLISTARRLLSHALLHDPSNSMFILLSSTCVPLHSFNFTYNLLFSSNKSFIEILKNEPRSLSRYMARGDNVMTPEVPFESFRMGSQFFILTRRHARLVVKDERVWAKFKLPCVSPEMCYPEEQYFSTLLSMEDPRGCVPATLTHVDWTRSRAGHPRTYQAWEVGRELIVSLRSGRIRYGNGGVWNGSERNGAHGFLFARKFSPECLQPLMGLANDVIFRD